MPQNLRIRGKTAMSEHTVTTGEGGAMTRLKIGFAGTLSILLPYVRDNLFEQIKSVWFIVFYLLFFQIVILGLPIVHSSMIAVGLLVVEKEGGGCCTHCLFLWCVCFRLTYHRR